MNNFYYEELYSEYIESNKKGTVFITWICVILYGGFLLGWLFDFGNKPHSIGVKTIVFAVIFFILYRMHSSNKNIDYDIDDKWIISLDGEMLTWSAPESWNDKPFIVNISDIIEIQVLRNNTGSTTNYTHMFLLKGGKKFKPMTYFGISMYELDGILKERGVLYRYVVKFP